MSRGALLARPAWMIGVAVALVCSVPLLIGHRPLHGPLSRTAAIAAARRDPSTARALRAVRGPIDAEASPIDTLLERVTFSKDGRILAEVALDRGGNVAQSVSFTQLKVPYGARLAYEPLVLLLLAAIFVLCTAVWPLRRIRNLDVLAMLTLLAPMLLLQQRFLAWSVLSAVPGLAYLLVRCVRFALGRAEAAADSADSAAPEASAGPAAPAGSAAMAATPLFDLATHGWDPARRARLLRMLLAMLALIFVMVSVSSSGAIDVPFALMEGATKLVHGVIPYGHMPGDVIHGDTYPLFSYLVYVPLALLAPVNSTWDSVDLGLGFAAAAAVLAALLIAGRSVLPAQRRGSSSPAALGREHSTAGLRAAIAWLSFPPVLAISSSGTSDVVLSAMLVAVVLLWRRPRAGAAMLAAATWFKLAPAALLLPFLAPLRGRRLGRALTALVVAGALPLVVLVSLAGADGIRGMVDAVGWQLSRGSPQSLWVALGIGPLQPLGQAATLGLIAAGAVRLRRAPELAEEPARVAALVAAVLIALQLSADYWAFLYLAWVVPPLALSLLSDLPAHTSQAIRPVSAKDQEAPAWRRSGTIRTLRAPSAVAVRSTN